MVREDGVLKLMDFGIAKMLDRDERMTDDRRAGGLARAHGARRSSRARRPGPEADVFSLGTMLYLLATGPAALHRPPTPPPRSSGSSTATTRTRASACPRSPTSWRRSAPRASRGTPPRRYPNAGKLRDALGGLPRGAGLRPRGRGAERPSSRTRPRTSRAGAPRDRRHAARARGAAARGEAHARALACLNQVLALDATNARALALLKGLQRPQRGKQVAQARAAPGHRPRRRGPLALRRVEGAAGERRRTNAGGIPRDARRRNGGPGTERPGARHVRKDTFAGGRPRGPHRIRPAGPSNGTKDTPGPGFRSLRAAAPRRLRARAPVPPPTLPPTPAPGRLPSRQGARRARARPSRAPARSPSVSPRTTRRPRRSRQAPVSILVRPYGFHPRGRRRASPSSCEA